MDSGAQLVLVLLLLRQKPDSIDANVSIVTNGNWLNEPDLFDLLLVRAFSTTVALSQLVKTFLNLSFL